MDDVTRDPRDEAMPYGVDTLRLRISFPPAPAPQGKYACKALGVDSVTAREAIRAAKRRMKLRATDTYTLDLKVGDILWRGETIGNFFGDCFMSRQQGLSGDEYDLSLRLWSDHTPLQLIVSKSGLCVDDLAIMGEKIKGSNRTERRHFSCLASRRVHTEQDAAAWLAATLEQLDRTATRFGPDIEALFWIAQLEGERVPSMIPNPALVARAVQTGARIFVGNYTLPGDDDTSGEGPANAWYPPD